MAMTAGTITVNADGTHTSTGFAGQVMTDLVSEYDDALAAMNAAAPPVAERVKVLQALARQAQKFADLITYIQANARTGTENETIV